jgi:Uma2 family endonuclease
VLHLQANPGQGLALTDVEFTPNENSRVRPDVLVLLGSRAKELDVQKVPVPGAPDLAGIISASERSSDTQEKLQQYLRHGTQEVWQVYRRSQSVVVHRGDQSTTLLPEQQLVTPLLLGVLLEIRGSVRVTRAGPYAISAFTSGSPNASTACCACLRSRHFS